MWRLSSANQFPCLLILSFVRFLRDIKGKAGRAAGRPLASRLTCLTPICRRKGTGKDQNLARLAWGEGSVRTHKTTRAVITHRNVHIFPQQRPASTGVTPAFLPFSSSFQAGRRRRSLRRGSGSRAQTNLLLCRWFRR